MIIVLRIWRAKSIAPECLAKEQSIPTLLKPFRTREISRPLDPDVICQVLSGTYAHIKSALNPRDNPPSPRIIICKGDLTGVTENYINGKRIEEYLLPVAQYYI